MPSTILNTNHYKIIFIISAISFICFYDFALVIYLNEILREVFFAKSSNGSFIHIFQLIGTVIAGYIARPFGAFLLGQYGDINGRKAVITLSLVGMSVFTLIVSLLPAFSHIGHLASFLFLIARFGQGLSYGGQLTSAWALAVEQMPLRFAGLACGLVMASVIFSMLTLYVFVGIIENTLSRADMLSYGWRIPFLLGGILSFVLIFFSHQYDEVSIKERKNDNEQQINSAFISTSNLDDPTILELKSIAKSNIFAKKFSFNISRFFKNHSKSKLSSIFPSLIISWIMVSIFSVLILLLPDLITSNFSINFEGLDIAIGVGVLFMGIGSVFFGYLTDCMNAGKVIIIGSINLILQSVVFFTQLQSGSDLLLVWLALLGFAGGVIATLPVALVKLFPSQIRLTYVSVTYNITNAIVGAALPILLGYASFYVPFSPAIYLSWIGLMGIFIGLYVYHLPHTEYGITR